eukprot:13678835-Ditylum_brightwellii.AAC.1
MGHTIDLRDFQNGLPNEEEDDPSNNSHERTHMSFMKTITHSSLVEQFRKDNEQQQDASESEQRNSKRPCPTNGILPRGRRKVRIGLDVSGWIARAIHGHGAALVDERILTNCGRAQLLWESKERKEKYKEQQ